MWLSLHSENFDKVESFRPLIPFYTSLNIMYVFKSQMRAFYKDKQNKKIIYI